MGTGPFISLSINPDGTMNIKHNLPSMSAAVGFTAQALEALREQAYRMMFNEKEKSMITVPQIGRMG